MDSHAVPQPLGSARACERQKNRSTEPSVNKPPPTQSNPSVGLLARIGPVLREKEDPGEGDQVQSGL